MLPWNIELHIISFINDTHIAYVCKKWERYRYRKIKNAVFKISKWYKIRRNIRKSPPTIWTFARQLIEQYSQSQLEHLPQIISNSLHLENNIIESWNGILGSKLKLIYWIVNIPIPLEEWLYIHMNYIHH
jgi:hypothetical protein